MSRLGDCCAQGAASSRSGDGDAFAAFAAIAPFVHNLLEIDATPLVDLAAELDDDAFAGFCVLSTLAIDEGAGVEGASEGAAEADELVGEGGEGASESAQAEGQEPVDGAPGSPGILNTGAFPALTWEELWTWPAPGTFPVDDDELSDDRSLSRASTSRQHHLWYANDRGVARFLGTRPLDWWHRGIVRPENDPVHLPHGDFYLQAVINGDTFSIAFTEATWTTSNEELNPWSREAARRLYNSFPDYFDRCAQITVAINSEGQVQLQLPDGLSYVPRNTEEW
jgi:hypothetical protein